jgi:large subunit ribosomal protein L25
MGLVNLNIHPRSSTGKNANRRTRAAGRIPAVVYGRDRATDLVELDTHDFTVALNHLGGRAAIFSLEQEGVEEEHIALMREVQRNPVTDEVLHVDLMEIPRGVPVTVAVSVEVIGEPAAVKTGEGSVALSLDAIEISCRPSELPEYLEVDISDLELNDKIFVRDVATPVGEIVTDEDMLVLNIKPATIFIEEEEEVEGEEGEEGAEGAEGEGAPEAEGGDEKSDD